LEHGTATSIALNRRGTLLAGELEDLGVQVCTITLTLSTERVLPCAAGTAEGSVVVWDFGTKGVAKKYSGHASAVTGVCWSRDGRHIASGSEDRHVVLWDVLSGTQVWEGLTPTSVCIRPSGCENHKPLPVTIGITRRVALGSGHTQHQPEGSIPMRRQSFRRVSGHH